MPVVFAPPVDVVGLPLVGPALVCVVPLVAPPPPVVFVGPAPVVFVGPAPVVFVGPAPVVVVVVVDGVDQLQARPAGAVGVIR